jgi:hypothetical protein
MVAHNALRGERRWDALLTSSQSAPSHRPKCSATSTSSSSRSAGGGGALHQSRRGNREDWACRSLWARWRPWRWQCLRSSSPPHGRARAALPGRSGSSSETGQSPASRGLGERRRWGRHQEGRPRGGSLLVAAQRRLLHPTPRSCATRATATGRPTTRRCIPAGAQVTEVLWAAAERVVFLAKQWRRWLLPLSTLWPQVVPTLTTATTTQQQRLAAGVLCRHGWPPCAWLLRSCRLHVKVDPCTPLRRRSRLLSGRLSTRHPRLRSWRWLRSGRRA